MVGSEFVGRRRELELLDRLWESPKATLLILYGRRRVGKTRLLTHWLEKRTEHGLYWMAEATSALEQLRSFSQALIHFADPDTPAPPDFTYASWELALRQVALIAQNKRMALVIDELTYLIDVNPNIVAVFQKTWDHWLSKSNLMLAFSGSQMSLMQKNLLAYDAPLYGRATAQVKLPPLPFGVSHEFFPEYTAADRIKVYSMWGGVPAYWERLNAKRPILDNLRQHLLPSHSWMLDEPRILLQDFINDPHNYVGIMRAIADGEQALGQIAKRTGLSNNHVSFYLSVLQETGFVARRVPVTQDARKSRQGRYYVTDPYLRFYYRFLAAFQSKLALGKIDQTIASIQDSLPAFIQANSWVELCQEWLLRASSENALPLPVEKVGSEWKRSFGIDVMGLSSQDKSIILGDCYWQAEPAGVAEVTQLVKKTAQAIPAPGQWQIYYTLFSASGWTAEAQAQAEQIAAKNKPVKGQKKWDSVGIKLLDLEELDRDLIRWSVPLN